MRKTTRNFLSFLLGLVLTVITVSVLSVATSAKTDATAVTIETVSSETDRSAGHISVSTSSEIDPWVCTAAFAAILSVTAVGVVLVRKNGKKRVSEQKPRRYEPRSDMTFSAARYRV